jgi:nitrogen fixation NifU-like protein
MNSELEELYQQVLLEHSKRPRNFGELENGGAGVVHVHGDNPSCGDEIHLHVRFGKDGRVEEVKFTGRGCAISQAAASLMTVKIQGKARADAVRWLRAFQELVTTPVTVGSEDDAGDAKDNANDSTARSAPAPLPAGFGDLTIFRGVRKFPQRVKCAMLPWRALEQALESEMGGGAGKVSTE